MAVSAVAAAGLPAASWQHGCGAGSPWRCGPFPASCGLLGAPGPGPGPGPGGGAAAPLSRSPGAAASPPLRHGRRGGRGRAGRPPLAPGLLGLQGGRPRQDVLAEEVERRGHVELGRGVRHLRHLPGAGHG